MSLDKFIYHTIRPFRHTQNFPMALCSPLILLSPALDNHWSDFCPYTISFSRMSYRSVQYIAFWAWLLLLSIMQLRFVYVAVLSVVPSFSWWVVGVPLCGCTIVCYPFSSWGHLVGRKMTLGSLEPENVLLCILTKGILADLVKVKDFEMGRLFWIMQVIPVLFTLSNLKGKKSRLKRCAMRGPWLGAGNQQGSRDFGPSISGNWQPKWAGNEFSPRASRNKGSV